MKNVIIRPATFNFIIIIDNYHHGQFRIKHRPQSNPRHPLAPSIRKCRAQRLNEPHAGLTTTSCPITRCPCNGRPRAQDQPTRKVQRNTPQILRLCQCRNLSFGLATKAKGLQGCGPRGSPGVTSHIPESARKCEGGNLHTPKATPTLGDGVPVDSQNFKEQFEGSKRNDLWRSLYHWKALET